MTPSEVRQYLTFMTTTVSTKGQIVLPADLRRQDAVVAGEKFEVERLGPGDYRLIRRSPPRDQGLVDLLLRCPEKGFFVAIDAIESESTDSL